MSMKSLLACVAVTMACTAIQTPALAGEVVFTKAPLAATAWIVRIEGDSRARKLVVAEEILTQDGADLTAWYGMIDGYQPPAIASIRLVDGVRQLVLTTSAQSEIVADELPNGTFAGTFKPRWGATKSVVLSRVSDDAPPAASPSNDSAVEQVPRGVRQWAGKPELFVGDTWLFDFADALSNKPHCPYRVTVERVFGSTVVARVAPSNGCEVSITTAYPVRSNSLQRFDSNFNHFHYGAEPYPAFEFPLYVSKTWARKWNWKLNGWSYSDDLAATVESYEHVTTPAGGFDAYRIRIVRKYAGTKSGQVSQAGTVVDTFWYAPQAKNFVKRTYTDPGWSQITRELLSLDVRPPGSGQSQKTTSD